MKRNELLYLGTMADAARAIVERIAGLTREQFELDEDVRLAFAHRIHIISRAAEKMPVEYAAAADMYRRVSPDSITVDRDALWLAAAQEVPKLFAKIEPLLPSEPPSPRPAVPGRLAIPIRSQRIAEFCRKWKIARLSLFGSAVRDDFTPESDVDVLVEFEPGETPGMAFFSDLPNELSEILGGRPVDVVTASSLSRWIRDEVLAEAVTIYDATAPPAPRSPA